MPPIPGSLLQFAVALLPIGLKYEKIYSTCYSGLQNIRGLYIAAGCIIIKCRISNGLLKLPEVLLVSAATPIT